MLVIKELSKENKKEIEEVFLKTFSEEPWCDTRDFDQLDLYMDELLAPFNSLTFGLFLDEVLIGISLGRIAHFYDGTQYRVDEFCIKSGFHGLNYGSKFMTMLSEETLKRNIKYIILTTERAFPAYQFYLKNGFDVVDGNVMLAKKIF